MPKIDAHQHFWKYHPVKDAWITDEMAVLQKDFLPSHLESILQANGIDGCVAVQAGQSEQETDFLLVLADEHDFIKGIVGWVDLVSPSLEERLEHYSGFGKLKGFRHILQGEKQRNYMLQDVFMQGVALLEGYHFTYDILVYEDQLPFIKEFVSAFPRQRFVIDHLGKPGIKGKRLDAWGKQIQEIAAYENVSCKLSGMVTEADWKRWKEGDFLPVLDTVVNAFGTGRLLFGSDWPVCLLAASYEQTLAIVKDYFASFPEQEQEKIFGQNAIEFYNL